MKFFGMIILSCTVLFAQDYDERVVWRVYQAILNASTSTLSFQAKYGNFEQTAVNYEKIVQSPDLLDLIEQQKQTLMESSEPMRDPEKLAFWINAYNFFTLVDMVQNHPVESMKDVGWKEEHHNVHGKNYSLDQIEHEILRKLNEPRIHFAINCASLSCPSLARTYYSHRTLEKQLDFAVRNALKNPLHLAVEKEGAVLATKLFDWFEIDWGGSVGVKEFVSKYGPVEADEISSFSYDWSVNTKENYDEKFKDLAREYPHYGLTQK